MTALSFEFYPPKTDDQRAQLERAVRKLKAFAPTHVSCTFGAGGSTLSYTSETVRHLRQAHGLEAAPHLSCVGGTREEIRELLKLYRALGCTRSFGDLQAHVNGIAVAFNPGGGLPVMAISCAGPAFSLSQEFLLNEVRPRLIEMARKLQASAGRT